MKSLRKRYTRKVGTLQAVSTSASPAPAVFFRCQTKMTPARITSTAPPATAATMTGVAFPSGVFEVVETYGDGGVAGDCDVPGGNGGGGGRHGGGGGAAPTSQIMAHTGGDDGSGEPRSL